MVKGGLMLYIKHLGLLHIGLHKITKLDDDPYAYIPDELIKEIVTVLAKYEFIVDSFNLNFTDSKECERSDILHSILIEAGKRIEAEKQLKDQQRDDKD